MKPFRKNLELFFLIALSISSCGISNKISYTKQIKKSFKKVEKEVNSVTQTYFIHSNDSIYQVFTISAVKSSKEVTLVGNTTAMDTAKLAVYKEMKGKSKIIFKDSLKRANAYQAHIYVDQLHLNSSNRFVLDESNTVKYERYSKSGGKFPGLPRWLSITLTVLLGVVLVGGGLIALAMFLGNLLLGN